MNYRVNDIPWIEKSDYKADPYYNTLSPKQQSQVDTYHEKGYLIIDDIDMTEGIDLIAMRKLIEEKYDWNANRVQDAWKFSPDVKNIACNENVLKTLEMLYGRRAIIFQSLSFLRGTQQKTHSDFLHFNTLPYHYMCGVWTALEDVNENNGPLHYYEGSHKHEELDYEKLGINTLGDNYLDQALISTSYAEYERKIKIVAENYQYKELHIKKGSCLIWSSNLLHGGSKIKDDTKTRFSQVSHYLFENTIPITPMLSEPSKSNWMVRNPIDVRTMKHMDRNYNGNKVVIPAGSDHHRVKVELPSHQLGMR